jgi:hypothetical protein
LKARFNDHESSFSLPQLYVIDLATGEAAAAALPEGFAQFAKKNGSKPKDLPLADTDGGNSLLEKLISVSRNEDGSQETVRRQEIRRVPALGKLVYRLHAGSERTFRSAQTTPHAGTGVDRAGNRSDEVDGHHPAARTS